VPYLVMAALFAAGIVLLFHNWYTRVSTPPGNSDSRGRISRERWVELGYEATCWIPYLILVPTISSWLNPPRYGVAFYAFAMLFWFLLTAAASFFWGAIGFVIWAHAHNGGRRSYGLTAAVAVALSPFAIVIVSAGWGVSRLVLRLA